MAPTLSLLPGPRFFQVTEMPAYLPAGDGEHLYVEIEKEGLTTDLVAQALAKTCGRRDMDVGYAGRKDRHAITSQWFSVHFGKEEQLAGLTEHVRGGRVKVLNISRHRNKLRLGHLAGNRFRLGIGLMEPGKDRDETAPLPPSITEKLTAACAALHHQGLINRFGAQRFGIAGATLAIAKAWGSGDLAGAVERIVDPTGAWRIGQPVPDRWYGGPEGRLVASLRRDPTDPVQALKSIDDRLRKLVASAGQSGIFNAILDAREAAGLLHRMRPGDLGCNIKGAPFLVTESECASTNARCAAGVLDAFATGPLPGTTRLRPEPAILAEEQAWSAATGIAWTWFETAGIFASPGERRPLVVALCEAPTVQVEGSVAWLQLHLPSGCYATMALTQVEVAIPTDRREG